MSFITNIFLWLLPLISVPLIIHLLNRRKIIKIDFSSIQFLKELKSESIKRINILQWLLLIIRTLIILLIILMMSRPILKGYFPSLKIDPSSSLSIIMIDDSFSMHGIYNDSFRQDIIYNAYQKILNTLSDCSASRMVNPSPDPKRFTLEIICIVNVSLVVDGEYIPSSRYMVIGLSSVGAIISNA